MAGVKISDNLYWVGAVDRDIKSFHGHTYETSRGTTYNAYLIVDEKITLVDTVSKPFFKDMLANISSIVSPDKIDYIIVNHVEDDHSGALPELLKICKKARLYGSSKCKEGLYRHYYADWDFHVVKTGDTLSLGRKNITFIEAPMLHWPDSMFTYIDGDAVLLPNDAFGQHYATDERFDDEVDQNILMEEAARYYANILWPFSGLVVSKIKQLLSLNIPVKVIAPSHGLIWRKEPSKIIDAYLRWGANTAQDGVVIAYETMWGATQKMADEIARGVSESGVPVQAFDINKAQRSEIIRLMLETKAYIIGSSTHDNSMLPNMAGFLHFLEGLKPKNRIGGAFGSYGWAGGAAEAIEKIMRSSGIEVFGPPLTVRYVPDKDEIKACYEFGKSFVGRLQKKEGV